MNKNYTKKEQLFIKWIKSQCRKYGVKCRLKNVSYLRLSGSIKCSGYFDDGQIDNPALVVAMNRPDWIEILAHEYCHLTQWLEKQSIWYQAGDSLPYIDEWLTGTEVPDIEHHLGVARDLELDNEKRTVELIKDWGLNVDIDNYIKKANAYIHFYNYVATTRRWSKPENAPYINEVVLGAMPPHFNMEYKELDKSLHKLYVEENI